MKKIDDIQHQRLLLALEKLQKELCQLQMQDEASMISTHKHVLKTSFRKYNSAVSNLIQEINSYDELFHEVHTSYRETLRLKAKKKRKRNNK